MLSTIILLSLGLTASVSASLLPQHYNTTNPGPVTDAQWDGECFYPKPDPDFKPEEYLGRWYQVATSRNPFSSNCACVAADYSAGENGTINVFNQCQRGDAKIGILGAASPVNPAYGEKGVLRVEFPGANTTSCPGPNYIVQEYEKNWAIVQSYNFTIFFLLSRKQNVPDAEINVWLERAKQLGTDLSTVDKTNQKGCLYL